MRKFFQQLVYVMLHPRNIACTILLAAIIVVVIAIQVARSDMKMGPHGGSLSLPGVSSDGFDGMNVEGNLKSGSLSTESSRFDCKSAAPGNPTEGTEVCADGDNWRPGGTDQGTDDWIVRYCATCDGGTPVWVGLYNITTGARIQQSGGTGGYVAAPTYSDSACTVGQWSFDASYVYICEATDQWDRYAVVFAGWSNPAPTQTLAFDGGQSGVQGSQTPTITGTSANLDGGVECSYNGGAYSAATDTGTNWDTWSIQPTLLDDATLHDLVCRDDSDSSPSDTLSISYTSAAAAEILDDFSSDTSANYTEDYQTGTAALLIENGVAKASPAYRGIGEHHNTALSSSNQYLEGPLLYNGNDFVGLRARVSAVGDGYDDYYLIRPSSIGFTVYRVVNGAPTSIANAVGTSTADVTYAVRVEVTGTNPVNIKVFVDGSGTATIDYNDSAAERLQSGVLVGFEIKHSSSGLLDKFVLASFEASAL